MASPSDFETGVPGLVIQCPNNYAIAPWMIKTEHTNRYTYPYIKPLKDIYIVTILKFQRIMHPTFILGFNYHGLV